jgi:hypothetical protein
MPLPLEAEEPPPVELAALEPPVDEEPIDEPLPVDAPLPVDELPEVVPPLPAFVLEGALGFAAPISPAAVPGPARPALSVSAGEPCAA